MFIQAFNWLFNWSFHWLTMLVRCWYHVDTSALTPSLECFNLREDNMSWKRCERLSRPWQWQCPNVELHREFPSMEHTHWIRNRLRFKDQHWPTLSQRAGSVPPHHSPSGPCWMATRSEPHPSHPKLPAQDSTKDSDRNKPQTQWPGHG
jgi:hypothetical protein